MKRCFILLLALVMLLCACTPAADVSETSSEASSETSVAPVSQQASEASDEESTEMKSPDDFIPTFRFVAASDVHIGVGRTLEIDRLGKLFTTAYAYAEGSSYKKVDAVLFAGDLTNNGREDELTIFKNIVDKNVKEETTVLTVMGNHEYYEGGKAAYTKVIDSETDKSVTVNGYHFIGMSTSADDLYTSQQIQWLSDEMAKANAEDPKKPIFTFQHHHIKDTVYVSSTWYTGWSNEINAVYSKYSQNINFSGHSHGPVNNPTSFWQGDYTAVGTGTLSYFEMGSRMTYGTIPPEADISAQYWVVEVNAEGKVRLMPYNILTNDFFKVPGGDEYIVYIIDDVSDKSTFAYTDRDEDNKAPEFKATAAVTMSDITEKTAVISFPQAKDDYCVYSYTIKCDSASSKKEYKYFSEYYFEPMPSKMTFTLDGLMANTKYKVTVTPYDAFGKAGSPIESAFTTKTATEKSWNGKNKVTYKGTFSDFESLSSLKTASGSYVYSGSNDGDVYCGGWSDSSSNTGSSASLADGKGANGSKALEISSSVRQNQGLYLLANDENGNATVYESMNYLRVWVDFTDVDLRKGNFGLIAPDRALYTTDEKDGVSGLEFYYLPDGSDEWQTFTHGDDGCFGTEQASSVAGFKGYMAFPTSDFAYRYGTGSSSVGTGDSLDKIAGIYLFWDYASSDMTGKSFYLDEIQLVADYKAFDKAD